MDRLLWVCLAGALGTGARYLIAAMATERFGAGFPWGTLIVNVAGCFLMGAVMQVSVNVASLSPNVRLALTTGFLGGLTTYSSFAYETTALVSNGSRGAAALNFGLTTVACFAAVVLGLGAANLATRP